jgi:hypothetical protein
MRNKTIRTTALAGSALALALALGCNDSGGIGSVQDLAMAPDPDLSTGTPDMAAPPTMSFFITSRTGSGKLGGLAGADAICQSLATAVGAGGKTWRAYLSAASPMTNARDRIGQGPWYDAKLVKIADSVAHLHSDMNNLTKASGLDETGKAVPGRGDMPANEHDILTGSDLDGRLNGTATCADWTSDAAMGATAAVGHFDRVGGGANPTSWNFAHVVNGCSDTALKATGGAGRFYCFATN